MDVQYGVFVVLVNLLIAVNANGFGLLSCTASLIGSVIGIILYLALRRIVRWGAKRYTAT